MGYNPTDSSRVNFLNISYKETQEQTDETWRIWEEHRESVKLIVDTLPTHYKFLKDTIYT